MTAATAQAPARGTQAEFARAQGWSKSYVTKLKDEGRLVFDDDKRVDFAASLQRIKATTGAPERAAPPVQGTTYANAQERERFFIAELKRLEYEKAIGQLLDAEEVFAATSHAAAVIRSTAEGWGDRLPPLLAAAGSDEARIKAVLVSEIEALLAGMATTFARLAEEPQA